SAMNAPSPSSATPMSTQSSGPSISCMIASRIQGSSSFMTVLLSGAAAQHFKISGLECHRLHDPGDPEFLEWRDDAREGGHQVVLVVELDQHGPAQPGDQGAGRVAGIKRVTLPAGDFRHQMIDRDRYLPLHAGRCLALGHAG